MWSTEKNPTSPTFSAHKSEIVVNDAIPIVKTREMELLKKNKQTKHSDSNSILRFTRRKQ